jgi:hypothetical protein
MANDDEVGFWGNSGANWGLVMNTSSGNVGMGTLSPACKLHVSDSISGSASAISSHVAVIENSDASGNADVLALKIGALEPTDDNNFVTFFSGNTPIAAIEGVGPGVVSFRSFGGADFAECLPRLDPDEAMMEGDVVGIFAGRISRSTENAQHVSVVTRRPIVVGNAPQNETRHLYDQVSFLGQVPVRVRGAVQEGDYIIPSGLNDGVGLAMKPENIQLDHSRQIVGQAWASDPDEGVKMVTAVIGVPPAALQSIVGRQQAQHEDLTEEISRLREELKQGGMQ